MQDFELNTETLRDIALELQDEASHAHLALCTLMVLTGSNTIYAQMYSSHADLLEAIGDSRSEQLAAENVVYAANMSAIQGVDFMLSTGGSTLGSGYKEDKAVKEQTMSELRAMLKNVNPEYVLR